MSSFVGGDSVLERGQHHQWILEDDPAVPVGTSYQFVGRINPGVVEQGGGQRRAPLTVQAKTVGRIEIRYSHAPTISPTWVASKITHLVQLYPRVGFRDRRLLHRPSRHKCFQVARISRR
jgi:hypothetical protein